MHKLPNLVKRQTLKNGFNLLQPVYGLGLVAEIYEKTRPEWYHHYQLVKKGDLDSDVIEHLQLIFIELPKLSIHSPDEKKLRLLWLRFLREIDEKTKVVSEELLEVPEIAQAIQLAEEAAYAPGELAIYEGYWDQIRHEKTLMIDKYVEGRVQGLAEGKAEGLAEGEARGIEKIAINMLKANKPVDEIILFTGLSEKDITQLQKKMK